MPQDLLGMLQPSGGATSAMLQGAETGAVAGPFGAVAGGLVGLLSQSETFQGALGELESIFQALADSVGLLVEPLMPLLTVVGEVAAGLGALIGALSPIIEVVARPLFDVFRGLGLFLLNVMDLIGGLINSIAKLFGGKGFDMSGIGKAMERLEEASYDSAREQSKVAEKAREVSENLNVPSWWKVDSARFNAVEPGQTGGSNGGGGQVIEDRSTTEIHVHGVTDPGSVAQIVLDRIEEKKERRHGNRTAGEWIP